jgi:hypothetical protein
MHADHAAATRAAHRVADRSCFDSGRGAPRGDGLYWTAVRRTFGRAHDRFRQTVPAAGNPSRETGFGDVGDIDPFTTTALQVQGSDPESNRCTPDSFVVSAGRLALTVLIQSDRNLR